MPAEWSYKIGEADPRPPVSRIVNGVQEYPIAEHRTAKPPVDSVDAEAGGVPAREQAKADGTFGVELPYEQRERS